MEGSKSSSSSFEFEFELTRIELPELETLVQSSYVTRLNKTVELGQKTEIHLNENICKMS